MSVQKKPCARRLGLLCFPVSTALCAATLWAPSTAHATGFRLSPRGPGQDDAPVPYEPYEGETGGPTDRDNGQAPGDAGSENAPAQEDPAEGNEGQEGQDPATPEGQEGAPAQDGQAGQDAGAGEEEIQYDEAPAVDENQPPNPDQGAPGEAEQDAPEMEFGEVAPEGKPEGEGEQETEMEFGDAQEGEAGEQEMQFSDEPEGGEGEQEMQFSDEPGDDEGEQEMQFSDEEGAADEGDEPPAGFMFEDISEDEEALAKELQSGQRQAKGVVGTVRGTITGSDGQEVMGASVETKDKKYLARSGVDGTFELKLNPGVYTLRVFNDGYEERFFEGIEVKAKEDFTLDAQITPLPGAVQTMIIEEEVAKEGNVGQAIKRQKSRATRDIMSREEMSKSGGSSTSSVARRIVGSTIVGGRYIFVRGLGHRYGNTLLDGARVPSPNPDLRTVPLDIFPTAALSAINVQKTFTPDVPADFTGGSVQLETREIPERFTFKIGASIGGNTQTTFRQQLTSEGVEGADAFGFGNVERGLSDDIKNSTGLVRPELDPLTGTYLPPFLPEVVEKTIESQFLHTLIRSNSHAPINGSVNLSIGNAWKTGEKSKLGVIFAGGYSNSRSTRKGISRIYMLGDTEDPNSLQVDQPRVDYDVFQTGNRVGFNGLGLIKFKADDYNDIGLTAMYSRDADNVIRRNRGIANEIVAGKPIVSDRLRYTMRALTFTQLSGQHVFPRAKDLKLEWFGSFSLAQQDDPAIRNIVYNDFVAEGQGLQLNNAQPTMINYLNLGDFTEVGGISLELPFRQWSSLESMVKIGGWFEAKQRAFTTRNFAAGIRGGSEAPALVKSKNGLIDELLSPEMIGNEAGTVPDPLVIGEATEILDSYSGEQRVASGFAMLDLPLHHRFKLSGGARFEASLIRVAPRFPFKNFELDEEQQAKEARLTSRLIDVDVFPALNLTFSLNEKMNLRASGSQTIARPEMRELSPFTFANFVGGINLKGYPNLQSTNVWNADLRWEWFPEAGEVVSLSAFFKYMIKPVERVMANQTGQGLASFRNAKSARNIGFELEAKKGLGFLTPYLRPVTIGANFAYVYSRVQLPPKIVCDGIADEKAKEDCEREKVFDSSTSRARPLQGQSPFVANAFIDLDFKKSGTNFRVLYNTFGRRIARIGGEGLPDTYEESIHSLDAMIEQSIYSIAEQVDDEGNIRSPKKDLKLKLGVSNLLDSPTRLTQGEEQAPVVRFKRGANISLGVSWGF